jgi:hypothetical protein
MARTYLVFGDIEGELDVLRVECTHCQRKRRANMMKWKDQLNGDCPKRDAAQLHDRCDLICPDLPKVLCERITSASHAIQNPPCEPCKKRKSVLAITLPERGNP